QNRTQIARFELADSLHEVVDLNFDHHLRAKEVICASVEAGGARSGAICFVVRIDAEATFSGFNKGKAITGGANLVPVNRALPPRNVHPDRSSNSIRCVRSNDIRVRLIASSP